MTVGPSTEPDLWDRARSLPEVESDGLGFTRRFETPDPPVQTEPESGDPPETPAVPRPGTRRRWPRRVALGLFASLMFGVAMVTYGLWRLSAIERIPLDHVLSPPEGSARNYLVVGSDSREGIAQSDLNAGYLLGEGVPVGSYRSDTMMVLRLDRGAASLLSIPRDLWTDIDGTGGRQRINTAFAGGPERVIRTVQRSLGLPVHHYVEIDFVALAGIVESLGGITLEIPHPASDPGSGLSIPEAGRVTLDGVQALAYVRSREYTELIDGRRVVDGTGDLGRVQRQQAFLSAVLSKLGDQWNPLKLNSVAGAAADGLTVDDRLSTWDLARLGWRLRSTAPVGTSVPTYPYTTDGGAAVLGLTDDADTVLGMFR